MQVTCHPRLGVPPEWEAGVTGIKPTIWFYVSLLFAELRPESLVLSICISTLDAEVELDLRLGT